MSDLEDELRSAVGAAHVLVDGDLRAPYETDWTRRFTGEARCVVRPASTAEVRVSIRRPSIRVAPFSSSTKRRPMKLSPALKPGRSQISSYRMSVGWNDRRLYTLR